MFKGRLLQCMNKIYYDSEMKSNLQYRFRTIAWGLDPKKIG